MRKFHVYLCLCVCVVCVCMYVCLCDLGPQAIRAGAAGKKTTQGNRGEQEGELTRAHRHMTGWFTLYKSIHLQNKQSLHFQPLAQHEGLH